MAPSSFKRGKRIGRATQREKTIQTQRIYYMKATTKANENDPEPNNELCSHIIEGVSGYSRRAGKETNEPDSSKSNTKT